MKKLRLIIIVFIATSNMSAMLLKKVSSSKVSHSRTVIACGLMMLEKEKPHLYERHRYFEKAIWKNDCELVDVMLQNKKKLELCIKDTDALMNEAKTVEMIQIFEKHGYTIKNCKKHYLHSVIGCSWIGDDLIKHVINMGMDPSVLDNDGNNLWHRFAYINIDWGNWDGKERLKSVIQKRTQLLHTLGIDPYHKNNFGLSAIDVLEKNIQVYGWNVYQDQRETAQELLRLMKNKRCVQQVVNE